MSDHVCSTFAVVFGLLLILLAITLSSCSLLSIAPIHRFLIVISELLVLQITLSHLKFHIKYADSDIRILISLDAPAVFCLFSVLSLCWGCGKEISPQLRMMPMCGLGHCPCFAGHRFLAKSHIIFLAGSLQCTRMCSMFSISSLHSWHFALCAYAGIGNQKSPIWYALLRVLYMNICMFFVMSLFLHPRQIASSVSRVFDIGSNANLVISSRHMVDLCWLRWVFRIIALYANCCVISDSLAPCRSKLCGT